MNYLLSSFNTCVNTNKHTTIKQHCDDQTELMYGTIKCAPKKGDT